MLNSAICLSSMERSQLSLQECSYPATAHFVPFFFPLSNLAERGKGQITAGAFSPGSTNEGTHLFCSR